MHLAGHTGLGRLSAASGQPVGFPGEAEGRHQDVRSPVLQGVADLEGGRRKDKVPLRPEVRIDGAEQLDKGTEKPRIRDR